MVLSSRPLIASSGDVVLAALESDPTARPPENPQEVEDTTGVVNHSGLKTGVRIAQLVKTKTSVTGHSDSD